MLVTTCTMAAWGAALLFRAHLFLTIIQHQPGVWGPGLVVELRLWASMQDSGRLRPQSNSTMQAGTANVCILSICGVGALQADRLGVSRPQLQVQVQVPGAEARPARQAILTVGNESMHYVQS